MRFTLNRALGIVVGATLGWLTVAVVESKRIEPPAGPIISEASGALHEIAIHYISGADFVLPVYREFLPQLPGDVIVDVLCPHRSDFDELVRVLPDHRCVLRPIITGHPITAWSRDRWISLARDSKVTLVAPRGEAGAELLPARAGDQQVAFDLADESAGGIRARRSELYFDGGDFLADDQHVFVPPRVLRENLQRAFVNRAALIDQLQRLLGRNLVLLEDSPDHHAAMFMMSVGNRTMLVGDPTMGRLLVSGESPDLPDGPDFSSQTQEKFDAVARQVGALGYRVVRIPTVPARDGKSYLTYVNVIMDFRYGKSIVYLPQFQGFEPTNRAAAEIWRGLGFEVRQIDCTSTYRLFGNLHCLVNVVRRT